MTNSTFFTNDTKCKSDKLLLDLWEYTRTHPGLRDGEKGAVFNKIKEIQFFFKLTEGVKC